ncbi:MAG TPA: TonB-dependent receptor [Paludibacter sp.]|nr:TonB-dependent receptor [Paludibacter sp.]
MRKKSILLLLVALVSASSLFAQNIRVQGVVVDKKTGETLIGSSILQKGTTNGTTTSFTGEFSISVPQNSVLVVSYVGYISQEIKVTSDSPLRIQLQEDNKTLDEVVVIGYGTAKKRDLTGSIVNVSAKDLAGKPNSNPVASLQGKVTGLSVVNNGKPGQDPDIRIRGTVSYGNTKPLYIVDGIFNDNISFVNPADIESMEVLKDPSSLAIFGVRGANGVIIVTTKKGVEGKVTVSLNTSLGVKNIVGTPKMTDRTGFMTLYDEQRANQGSPAYTDYSKFNGNTNWIDQISQCNALVNTNSISISSGTDKNKLYVGIGYMDEQGLIKNETYNKFTASVNDELKISKDLKIGVNVNGSKANMPQLHDFISALNATPIVEPFNAAKGVYNKLPDAIGGPQIGNPLMFVDGNKNTQLNKEYRVVANGFLEYNFLKNFTFKVNYYADLGFNDGTTYTPKYRVYNAESDAVVNWNTKSMVEQYKNNYSKIQQDYLLTYKKQFGDHGITLLGGFTTYFENYSQTKGQVSQYAGGDPIPYDKRWWYLDVYPYGDPSSRIVVRPAITANPADYTPSEWERSTVSTLFRALYNYKGKYNLNASFRRDGSSEISPSNRYQNFWAMGGAWFLTQESFMQNQKVFNNLKIKASLGQLGNQYTQYHYPYYPNYVAGSSAVFGDNIVPAYELAYKNNPNLKWETVNAYEVGVEMDALQNKLHFEANYYDKRTKDLLTFVRDDPNSFYINSGSIKSSGVELLATWNQSLQKDLSFSISGNMTTMKNKVLSVWKDGYKYYSGNSLTEAGQPIGYFYGYQVEGVYQSYADKLASPVNTLGDYGPGDLKFKDINGDNKINSDDRTKIGNPTPDFTYGFSGTLNYKGFDLVVDFQGVYGNEVWRGWGNGASYAVFNYREARLGRWTGAGSSNWEPKVGNDAINNLPSTYMIEDGSYIRLRNVQLGYNFNKRLLSKIGISSLRFYVSGQNLITWKHNSGFTPESGGSAIEFGVDGGGYPIPAITTAGFNITF